MRKPLFKYKVKRAPLPKPSGHHLFAYRHFRTNQILYSLTHQLQDDALKQLPDLGANNNPPTIRPDIWRPFYSVTLPGTAAGKSQCLDAYQKLLNYKKLHELHWEPPAKMSEPLDEEALEKLQERLDKRGGSKKESKYDLAARQKWQMRLRTIMDQKANSIADLAAVMLEQEEIGAEAMPEVWEDREEELRIMEHLADEAQTGRLDSLKQELKSKRQLLTSEDMKGQKKSDLQAEIARLRARRNAMQYASRMVELAKWWADLPVELRNLGSLHEYISHRKTESESFSFSEEAAFVAWTSGINQKPAPALNSILERKASSHRQAPILPDFSSPSHSVIHQQLPAEAYMTESTDGPTWQPVTEQDAAPEQDAAREQETATEQDAATEPDAASQQNTSDVESSAPGKEQEPEAEEAMAENELDDTTAENKVEWRYVVPPFPLNFQSLTVEKRFLEGSTIKLRGIIKRRAKRQNLFSMDNITVRWDNLLDAEFAETWPQALDLQPMGRIKHSRHPSPIADLRPKEEFEEWNPEEEIEGEGEPVPEVELSPAERLAAEQAERERRKTSSAQRAAIKLAESRAKKGTSGMLATRAAQAGAAALEKQREKAKRAISPNNSRAKAKVKRFKLIKERRKAGLPVISGYKGEKSVWLDSQKIRKAKKAAKATA